MTYVQAEVFMTPGIETLLTQGAAEPSPFSLLYIEQAGVAPGKQAPPGTAGSLPSVVRQTLRRRGPGAYQRPDLRVTS
jgi:hypothetical protein